MLCRRADLWNDSISKNAPWTREMKPLPTPVIERRATRDENVRRLAYFQWEQAGKPEGMSDLFWFQAEQEYARQVQHAWPTVAERAATVLRVCQFWVARWRNWRLPRLSLVRDSAAIACCAE